jgi:hypothetical protein
MTGKVCRLKSIGGKILVKISCHLY